MTALSTRQNLTTELTAAPTIVPVDDFLGSAAGVEVEVDVETGTEAVDPLIAKVFPGAEVPLAAVLAIGGSFTAACGDSVFEAAVVLAETVKGFKTLPRATRMV